jgi:uncharacterized membrane protein YGL010W
MRNATTLLTQYAQYHRDSRNLATHFLGVPMIVLARARFEFAGVSVTAAGLAWVLSTLWYMSRRHLVLGLAVSAAVGALLVPAHFLAQGTTAAWLQWGLGLFALGWVIQFVGHYFEGRKPAFADDLVGLLVGPMFMVAEALFAMGFLKKTQAEIEKVAGPVHGAATGAT